MQVRQLLIIFSSGLYSFFLNVKIYCDKTNYLNQTIYLKSYFHFFLS